MKTELYFTVPNINILCTLNVIIMNLTKTHRDSNLEILRIISMFFIIAHHFSVHGFENVVLSISNPNNLAIYFFGILGKIGVDVFILISAYFMINSKFTFKKLLLLGGEVYFYSILFLAVFTIFLTPLIPITIIDVKNSILPISHAYWFITDYIVLMLLSPFLNKFIKGLSKNNYLKLLVFLIIIWSIFTTFTGGTSFGYSSMVWFIVLYLIGSFIRLHLDISKINSKKLIIIFMVSFLLMYIGCYSVGYLILFLNLSTSQVYLFSTESSIFTLITSTSLFLIFLKRKRFSNKYINYIAGSVLGVYLIHDNVFVRPYLWKYVLHTYSFYSSSNLLLFAIISIIFVYLVCTGIDIIRRMTIERIYIYIIDTKLINLSNWVRNKFNVFEEKIQYFLK